MDMAKLRKSNFILLYLIPNQKNTFKLISILIIDRSRDFIDSLGIFIDDFHLWRYKAIISGFGIHSEYCPHVF